MTQTLPDDAAGLATTAPAAVASADHARRRYPAYRDSGVPWLGAIPAHWEVKRLKRFCSAITDGAHYSPPTQPNGKPYVTVRDLSGDDVDIDHASRISDDNFTALASSGCQPQIGDVLLSKDGTIGKAVVVSHDDFVVLSSLAILRPKRDSDPGFLRYFLLSPLGLQQMLSYMAGAALRRLTLEVIVDLIAVAPPLDEQRKIAAYLDGETARLDGLVAGKQRLIGLLREKRAALISQAVTRGLDASVALRESGVPWLGQIPAHWEVKRLKWIASMRYGLGQPPRELDGGLPLIRATNVEHGKIVSRDMMTVDPSDVPVGRGAILHENEIIVVRSGAYTGDSAIIPAPYEGAIAGYDMVVTVTKASPAFVAYVLLSDFVVNGQMMLSRMRAAQPHLNVEEAGDILLALPSSLDEQTRIASHIAERLKGIDALVSAIERQIEKLREYRAGVIAAAVTGRVDVR